MERDYRRACKQWGHSELVVCARWETFFCEYVYPTRCNPVRDLSVARCALCDDPAPTTLGYYAAFDQLCPMTWSLLSAHTLVTCDKGYWTCAVAGLRQEQVLLCPQCVMGLPKRRMHLYAFPVCDICHVTVQFGGDVLIQINTSERGIVWEGGRVRTLLKPTQAMLGVVGLDKRFCVRCAAYFVQCGLAT
jgi:hypothetical protein